MNRSQTVVAVAFLLLLSIFSWQVLRKENKGLTLFRGQAMGMDFVVQVGKRLDEKEQQQVAQAIEAIFFEVHAKYDNWNPDSEISLLNRMPPFVPIPLSPQLSTFLERVGEAVQLSGRRFDPTVAPLCRFWRERAAENRYPDEEEIREMQKRVGWDYLVLDQGTCCKRVEGIELDLGGVAKGYAIDLLLEKLSKGPWEGVYVEWGGEIRTSGCHPSGRPWRVFLSRFGSCRPEEALAVIELDHSALATSGNYFQEWDIAGKKCTHVIDPSSGIPLLIDSQQIASASIQSSTCLLADALATAALIQGEEGKLWLDSLVQQGWIAGYWLCKREGESEAPSSSSRNLFHFPRPNRQP